MHVITSRLPVLPLVALFLCTTSNAYVTSDTSLPAETAVDDSARVFTDPWPARFGIAPFFGRPILFLQKRECLENGSNFCFDDPRRLCPDCGGCCELDGDGWCCSNEDDTCCPGKTCCRSGEACCGDGCCPKGRRCSDGKCEVPVVTVTSTKTVHATRTHSEVEVVTVQMKVQVTSTLNSIIISTITSDKGTQTDVTYETTTLMVKRSLPTPAPERQPRQLGSEIEEEPPGIVGRALWYFWRRLVFGGHLERPGNDDLLASSSESQEWETEVPATIHPRQDDDSDYTSTVTITKTTTLVDETTVEKRRTTTNTVTSTITKTIFQTSTRIVGAKETTSITSTVTITSRPPSTETVTSTSTDFFDPTGDTAPPATTSSAEGDNSSSSSTGLSTPAMIGIGVSTGFVALVLAAVGIVLLRRHRKRKNDDAFPADYVIAPQPAPIPSPRRDTYFTFKEKSPGHSRGVSATTQGSEGGLSSDNRDMGMTQRRNFPHPSSSSVGRMPRFAELEGTGPGGMG